MTEIQGDPKVPVALHGNAVNAIMKLLNSQSLMSLATNSPEGQPHLSTVGYHSDGLNLYFVTARDSAKRANLLADPRAAAAIRGRAEEGEAVGLSIEGTASEVTDAHVLASIFEQIHGRAAGQAPFAPSHDDAVAFKLVPSLIKAVAVINGHSRAQSFTIGDVAAQTQGQVYAPSAIARLF